MTPEEIVADIRCHAIQKVIERGVVPSEAILDLMCDMGLYGFQLGSGTALSMVKGAMVVQLAKLQKSNTKEG